MVIINLSLDLKMRFLIVFIYSLSLHFQLLYLYLYIQLQLIPPVAFHRNLVFATTGKNSATFNRTSWHHLKQLIRKGSASPMATTYEFE